MFLTASRIKIGVVSVDVGEKEMRGQIGMIGMMVMVMAYGDLRGMELGDESKPVAAAAMIKAAK